MTKTHTRQAIAELLVQLDLAISARLIEDPQTLNLFEAYGGLLDSLYSGMNGSQPVNDLALYTRLEQAQTALARLGVMGRRLPDAIPLETTPTAA